LRKLTAAHEQFRSPGEAGRGIGVYFPIVAKLPEFEEFLTAKPKKSKKEDQNVSSSFTSSTFGSFFL
jgi:hypothetical protein